MGHLGKTYVQNVEDLNFIHLGTTCVPICETWSLSVALAGLAFSYRPG